MLLKTDIGNSLSVRNDRWLPTNIASCIGFWTTDYGVLSATGSDAIADQAVDTWNNRVSGGPSWSQTTDSNRPTLKTSLTPSGRSALYFITDDYMGCNSLSSYFSGEDKQYTIAMVCWPASKASYVCAISSGSSSTTTPYSMLVYGNTNFFHFIRDNTSTSKTIDTGPVWNTTPSVLCIRSNGTTADLFFNSTTASVVGGNRDVGAATQDMFTLGSARRVTSLLYPWNGYIAYVAIFSEAISDSNLRLVMNNASSWSGISI